MIFLFFSVIIIAMEDIIYDAAIIGGGPAGASAAINLKQLNKKFIWFGESKLSSKGGKAEKITNYPGLYGVTGSQLMWAFKNHTELMNIQITDEVITGVYGKGGAFMLLAKDKQYEAKTVILCVGAEAAKTAEGESEFVGKGISYCATCDGFLYKGKTIGVYLTEKKYEDEAEYLCSLAQKVYLFPLYQDCEIKAENAEHIIKKPVKFTGSGKIERVHFNGGEREIDGMFILKSAISPTALIKGLKTENGAVYVDRKMATSVSGVFAAGDCTGAPYQYAKAVGEGNVAAHSAVEYLADFK